MVLRFYGGEACLRTGDARKPTIITGIRRWTSAAMAQHGQVVVIRKDKIHSRNVGHGQLTEQSGNTFVGMHDSMVSLSCALHG